MSTPEELLKGTPYLIADGAASLQRFEYVRSKAATLEFRAKDVQQRVREQTNEAYQDFWQAYRSDIVAESNRIEGYEWSQPEVAQAIKTHSALLASPTRVILKAIESDRHLAQVLGLYQAEKIAEELASSGARLKEYEIRGLHELVAAGETFAGAYKTGTNRIAGTTHQTTDPLLVSHAMGELVAWWQRGTGDAVLDATVAHSWLTYIHPFEDGNGRLARLMVNAALVQSGYPALMLRSATDRERYLDALSRSDEGDILPMYDFVTEVLARSIRVMAKEGYVTSVIQGELLGTKNQRFTHWRRSAEAFARQLTTCLERKRWSCSPQGFPDVVSYGLLEEQHPEGNCWYLKVQELRAPSKVASMVWLHARVC